MDFASVTDGLPAVALQLLSLAQTLSSHKRHRVAALCYASAARAPGVHALFHAYALYHSALELFSSLRSSRQDDPDRDFDRVRALAHLQKASILLRANRVHAPFSVQVFALIERIATYAADHSAAAKTINSALDALPSLNTDPLLQYQSFCYFRSRAIANALASGNSVNHAAALAENTAQQCASSDDHLSAAAFYLAQSQIALGASVVGVTVLQPNLQAARRHLAQLAEPPDKSSPVYIDFCLVRFAYFFISGLALIRSGDIQRLKQQLLSDLSASYSALRSLRKSPMQSTWSWLPHQYYSALTFYITTAVTRSNSDLPKALVHAMTALSRLGIQEDCLDTFQIESIRQPGVSLNATLSLAVALLENAARLRLTELSLEPAANLIAAAVDLAFHDDHSRAIVRRIETGPPVEDGLLNDTLCGDPSHRVGLIPRCVTFSLLADYHNLRGLVSGARIATQYLHAIISIANMQNAPRDHFLSDVWQLAVSHLALLTGDRRADIANIGREGPPVSESADPDFASGFLCNQVLAYAWFTIGVQHMRNDDVLESRSALGHCLDIINKNPHGNDQIVANAMTVLSGLIMTHQQITDDAGNMLTSALSLARRLKDQVTIVRASRQNRKLIHRQANSSPEGRLKADEEYDSESALLTSKQRGVGLLFIEEETR